MQVHAVLADIFRNIQILGELLTCGSENKTIEQGLHSEWRV